jgi:hypothetical protein
VKFEEHIYYEDVHVIFLSNFWHLKICFYGRGIREPNWVSACIWTLQWSKTKHYYHEGQPSSHNDQVLCSWWPHVRERERETYYYAGVLALLVSCKVSWSTKRARSIGREVLFLRIFSLPFVFSGQRKASTRTFPQHAVGSMLRYAVTCSIKSPDTWHRY